MGGENLGGRLWRPSEPGSSPRGRGKQNASRNSPPEIGLIPAWAGKTVSVIRWSMGVPAHPRVGGENPSLSLTACVI